MAGRIPEALLLLVVILNSASVGLIPSFAGAVVYDPAYDFVPPMPQFSTEAPSLNFTIPYPVPKPSPIFGEVTILIIAVEFSDYNHTLSIEEVTNQTINRLDLYYSHVSYGAVSIVGSVVGWARLPHRLSYYGDDNGPFVDDQNGDGYPDTWQLLKDAVDILGNEVHIIDYQHIVVLHAGYGQESSKRSEDVWSVTFLRRPVATDQGSLDRYAVVPEFEARGLETLGVYTHEFGHMLGLPDLYSRANEEVGNWDLMARGAWNGKPPGSSPAEMLAWDRIFLGWMTADRIMNIGKQARVNVTIDPIELPSSGYQVAKVQTSPENSKRYYLVEVRDKVGYDVALPSSGVLITYVDETKSSPVRVIDAVETTSTLDDATFQTEQKYSSSESSLVISIVRKNEASFSVVVDTMAPSPDIVVESLTLNPPNVHPNDTVSVSLLVGNEGTLKTTQFLVNLYLNETIFVSRKISLNPGETQEIGSTWTPVHPGTYVFRAVLDPENAISETTEDNNSKVLTVVVGYTLTLELRPPGAGGDLEWWFVVNGANQTYVGVGEFQIGLMPGPNTLHIQPLIQLNPSSRYVFRQWGDAVVLNPRTIEASTDIRLSVDFSMQYLLSLEPNGGVTGSGGWYDSGTPVTVSATSPSRVVEKESRSVFVGWSGDLESSSTNIVVNMTRPYNLTANWKLQYYLQVQSPYSASGEGWYDANAQAAISLSSPVETENGTRYLFLEWSGDLSGEEPAQKIVMSSPKFVSAIWTTLYEFTIESEYGQARGAGWYAPNSQAVYVLDALVIEASNGTRRVFAGWSGDAQGTAQQGSVTIDRPKTIRANWSTQYEIAFETKGVRNGTVLTLMVDGKPLQIKAPQEFAAWYDAGSTVSFSANATLGQGLRRYSLEEWRNSTGRAVESPQTVLKPETYTAVYKELSMFPCIIATATFGSEVSPEVQFLRNFRDRLVLSTRAGSAFMNAFNLWYYSFSPQVANFIANQDTTRTPVRVGLYPLFGILRVASATYSVLAFSPEFAVIIGGFVASALIGLIYLTPIDIFLVRVLSKRRIGGVHVLKLFSVSSLAALVTLAIGELTGSLVLLAFAGSALVLVTLGSAPLLFLFGLARIRNGLNQYARSKRANLI